MNHFEAFLSAMKADAALVHRPENLRWIAGYTGEGCLFIAKDARIILTDSRYTEQARRESPEWGLEEVSGERSYPALIARLASDHGARQVHVETDYLTYDGYKKLEEALASVELVPMDGIPEELREIKDEAELESIRKAAAIASDAFMNILPSIHAGMTEKQVQRVLEFEMLELGSGIGQMRALSPSLPLFALAAFLAGWGGLSVQFQTAAVLGETELSLRRHRIGRLLSGILSALLALLLGRLFLWN